MHTQWKQQKQKDGVFEAYLELQKDPALKLKKRRKKTWMWWYTPVTPDNQRER
jgi:hypothetical protein